SDASIGKVILLISTHPDDESCGAPATQQLLRDAGWRIINFTCSLGRAGQYERRRAELAEACMRAGLESVIADPPALIGSKDNLDEAQGFLTGAITKICQTYHPAIVISSHVHDRHHGHEVVARATRDALSALAGQEGIKSKDIPRWWMYGTWGELPYPTLYVPFGQEILDRVLHILSAYVGENERNDYRVLVESSATRNTIWGSEAIFGFGKGGASDEPYAEVLTELVFADDVWHEGQHSTLNVAELFKEPTTISASEWLQELSPQAKRRKRTHI
ncbi:MAG: PIG-L family deacetylase, partial [Patescibacteria group bacterium]